jgi:hypothetical protein
MFIPSGQSVVSDAVGTELIAQSIPKLEIQIGFSWALQFNVYFMLVQHDFIVMMWKQS